MRLAPILALTLPFCSVLAQPRLHLDRTSHAFGSISQKGKVTTRFEITNTGTDLLVIQELQTSCGCTSALIGRPGIRPGESSDVELVFDPLKWKGKVLHDVRVLSNDPDTPVTSLVFTAEVIPVIRTSREDLYFTGLLSGDCPVQEVRFAATSGRPLQLLGVEAPGVPYLRLERSTEGKDAILKVVVDGSRLPPGRTSGQEPLTLHTSEPDMPELRSTVFWSRGHAVQATPASLEFPPVKAGTSALLRLTVKQTQGRPFRILAVSEASGAFAPAELPAGAAPQHALTVRFTGPGTPGLVHGTLGITTDDPDQPALEVAVVGQVEGAMP